MHLLQTKPGGYSDEAGVVRLVQTPAEVVILSAADTDLALLAESYARLPANWPSLRLANLLHLKSHASVDLYLDEVLGQVRLIVASVLGGVGYWPYGVEQLAQLARARCIPLILVPGDDTWDAELARHGTVAEDEARRVWRYLREGGPANAQALLAFLGDRFLGQPAPWREPQPLPRVAVYHPRAPLADLERWQADWVEGRPVALLLFYRAHLQAGNTAAFDVLIERLAAHGLNPLPLAVASLKDPLCLAVIEELASRAAVAVIVNTTGFAMGATEAPLARPFARDVPVLQAILAATSEEDWRASSQGLTPRDLAMNVALPEVDGRIVSRAVTCKGLIRRCERTQCDVVGYTALPERMDFVAELARRWAELQRKPNADKRIALVLANYPTRDGRIGNGVGLDTPASALNILRALQAQGYAVADLPADGTALIHALLGQVTNDPDALDLRPCAQSLLLADYLAWFETLPAANRAAVRQRWGEPWSDPMFRDGRLMVTGLRFGLTFIGIQPARGYHLDPAACYHDPDLVPPHGYLAFYCWLRTVYRADAVVHVGKHGNLEWLPGKGIALSASCWPDAILGPLPHVYPFIVNDPGEGAQAKRRAQAVIIDHLIPPLTRAESYGPLRELERLADEYYEALGVDPKRAKLLRAELLEKLRETRLEQELGAGGDEDALLRRMDAYLCELKESQIRDGLHVFGESPAGRLRADTLLALARLPAGDGKGANRSLIRALAADFGLDEAFDPLDCDMAATWDGPRPAALQAVSTEPWRTAGDTRERLERYALSLLATLDQPASSLPHAEEGRALLHTEQVLIRIRERIAPALDACGAHEIGNLLAALGGRFVPAGPSGAPSRGRLEVLPTGRNFYSVDVRSIPTQTAWRIGFASATALIERHLQEHGDYPASLGLSVWGTATMRTGGDDIAQALALLGVRPLWEPGSNRVTDFEILPVDALGRPRVDVTLRVSGFFRDAFSNVIRLFDAAVQAVAELDETEADNPIRARVRHEAAALRAQGLDERQARRRAGWRVFGAKPGAYGAGLQGPIDERNWQERADLAAAYVNWGGYAYGADDQGTSAHETFRQRLAGLEAVVHNQDNREHDLLDSDDYYQFQGGMIAAAETLKGQKVAAYHGDHSQPEAPRIRTLKEEINRVLRARVVNPKWIEGVKRHGYKGAFEMAATLDYLFAFDATARVVDDYQYALVTDAYLLDPDTRAFLERHNPHALKEMAERLVEAMQRGLWAEPGEYRERIEAILLEAESGLEGAGG
ncbi:MAG TPA: cobaltochelatase subunit CobN [Candidatus Competibacteraceae bacterium]|nr:cobaltochelatase subunit CobN [Candidatus Competibacteraceae bacterium]